MPQIKALRVGCRASYWTLRLLEGSVRVSGRCPASLRLPVSLVSTFKLHDSDNQTEKPAHDHLNLTQASKLPPGPGWPYHDQTVSSEPAVSLSAAPAAAAARAPAAFRLGFPGRHWQPLWTLWTRTPWYRSLIWRRTRTRKIAPMPVDSGSELSRRRL
jgi:hypothetical protein